MNYFTEHKKNFKKALGRFVGSYAQPYKVKDVAEKTGLSEATIRTHIDEFGSLPSIPHLIIYFKIFGPDFADEVLSFAGLSVCRADEHEAPTTHEAQIMLAELMKEIIIAFEDGHLSKKEKAQLGPIARKVGQSLVALANEYDEESR